MSWRPEAVPGPHGSVGSRPGLGLAPKATACPRQGGRLSLSAAPGPWHGDTWARCCAHIRVTIKLGRLLGVSSQGHTPWLVYMGVGREMARRLRTELRACAGPGWAPAPGCVDLGPEAVTAPWPSEERTMLRVGPKPLIWEDLRGSSHPHPEPPACSVATVATLRSRAQGL